MKAKPEVSIIIPVYNDENALVACLEHLEQQTAISLVEVIIVDNANEPSQQLRALADKYSFTELIHEPKPGSYAARNRGIAHARADILAFTDADCQPGPHWVEAALQLLANDVTVEMVAGEVSIVPLNPDHPSSIEIFQELFAFRQQDNVKSGHSVTANLFVRRALFNQIGLFNEITKSGGDYEFTGRATRSGHQLVYCADAKVAHVARQSLAEYRHKIRRTSGGGYVLRKTLPRMSQAFSVSGLCRGFIPPLKGYLKVYRQWRKRKLPMGQACLVMGILTHNKYYTGIYRLYLTLSPRKALVR